MRISYDARDIEENEKKRFWHSLFFPFLFILLLWVIEILKYYFQWDLYFLGIYPLKLKGLHGIITAPLIHGDFTHLFNNSLPLLILSTSIFYFYKPVAFKVIYLVWIITGVWVWFSARQTWHIGASGLVYGYASFLFFSGIIRKNRSLLAISLLVAFLYGSLIWGIFPLKREISWESHLMGGVSGLLLAFYFKEYGPKIDEPEWDDEDEEDEDDEEDDFNFNQEDTEHRKKIHGPMKIKYIYRKKE